MPLAIFVVISLVVAAFALSHSFQTLGQSKKVLVSYIFPKVVSGNVTDSEGNLIPGMNVTVKMKAGSTDRMVLTNISDEVGFYAVTFAGGDWDPDNTIEVNASYGPETAMNSTTADNSPGQVLNLEFSVVIPEFDSSVVVPLIATVLIISVSVISRTASVRRDEEMRP